MTNFVRFVFTMTLVFVAIVAKTSSFRVEWNKIDESGTCYNTTIDCDEAERFEETYKTIFGELPN